MSREPIFEELTHHGRTMRHRTNHATPAAFQHDLRTLPVFRATIRALGWNGLHMAEQAADSQPMAGKR